MAIIYFGKKPSGRKASTLSIQTPIGEFEPIEPSLFRVYSRKVFIPAWSIMWSLLGLIVAIITFPRYVYAPTSTEGLPPNPPASYLPFLLPGMAIPIKKGRETSERLSAILLENGCTSMSFQGRTVWLQDVGTKELIVATSSFEEIDSAAATPERYLNVDSFKALLILLSITTQACVYFHYLAGSPYGQADPEEQGERAAVKNGWKSVSEYESNKEDTPVASVSTVEFTEKRLFHLASYEKRLDAVMSIPGSDPGTAAANSGVVHNNLGNIPTSFIATGDSSKITQPGYIMKYSEQLARPDINLVGDILGRYFTSLLGETGEDQFENLRMLKSGLGNLRLTSIGSELTHLYKCIEIAITSNAGVVPFFTGSLYEGCMVSGGPSGLCLSVQGELLSPTPVIPLKQSFLTISDHTSALNFIMDLLLPGVQSVNRILPTNMFDLRVICLNAKLTRDQMDSVTRRAALLNFKVKNWPINTDSLNRFASIINGRVQLSQSDPVGRTALFSKDILYVAMSCFGEVRCPSWETPNGTPCSWSRPNPPTPQVNVRKQSVRQGAVSDASWTMTVRKTKLPDAVDEFRRMATTMKYRSVSSVEARKSGYIVIGRDRMGVFWNNMRDALKVINPDAKLEGDSPSGVKRAADDSPDTMAGSTPGGVPGKRLRF